MEETNEKIEIPSITAEDEAAIKRKTAEPLPINPAAKGMKAADIRAALYSPITDDTHSVMAELKRVICEANIALAALESKINNTDASELRSSLEIEIATRSDADNYIKAEAVGAPTLSDRELIFPNLNGAELARVTLPSGEGGGTSAEVDAAINAIKAAAVTVSSYDEKTGKITITNLAGTESREINLFLDSEFSHDVYFDKDKNELVLILADGEELRLPVDEVFNSAFALVKGEGANSAVQLSSLTNRATGEAAAALGRGTLAGNKGWKISGGSGTEGGDGQYTLEGEFPENRIGAKYTVWSDKNYYEAGIVTGVSTVNGNSTVYVSNYIPFQGSDTDRFSLPDYPDVGVFDLAPAAFSHGYKTKALATAAYAGGLVCIAAGIGSHAEGTYTLSIGFYSYAGGYHTIAWGNYSHSEGEYTIAYEKGSYAGGLRTKATAPYQHVIGTYNERDDEALFIVGNGKSDTERSNAFVVRKDGTIVDNSLIDKIYPVGSIYMSTVNNSPASFLGGNWLPIEDKFLLACGSSYSAGDTGGAATHTLKESEMPAHQHTVRSIHGQLYSDCGGNGSNSIKFVGWTGGASSWSNPYYADYSGGGAAHNNMPPYLAVYMWKRIPDKES